MGCYNEQTWKRLGPALVGHGNRLSWNVSRRWAPTSISPGCCAGPARVVVRVKWARVAKGREEHLEVRCRLVAQELGYRKRLDELSAQTPSLTTMNLLLSVAGEKDLTTTLPDDKCAFSYGAMRRNAYFELPRQDPPHEDGRVMVGVRKQCKGPGVLPGCRGRRSWGRGGDAACVQSQWVAPIGVGTFGSRDSGVGACG